MGMSKRLFAALVVAALIGSFATAQAYIRRVAVLNSTDTCAYVTVKVQRNHGAYVLLQQPRLLKPRMDLDYPTGAPDKDVTAVMVRAEMKASADCSGKTVSDLEQPERAMTPQSVEYSEAVLLGEKGGYRIKF
jgi:hypothetical protein